MLTHLRRILNPAACRVPYATRQVSSCLLLRTLHVPACLPACSRSLHPGAVPLHPYTPCSRHSTQQGWTTPIGTSVLLQWRSLCVTILSVSAEWFGFVAISLTLYALEINTQIGCLCFMGCFMRVGIPLVNERGLNQTYCTAPSSCIAGPALTNMTLPEKALGYGSPAQVYPINFTVSSSEPVQLRLLRPKLLLAYGQVSSAVVRLLHKLPGKIPHIRGSLIVLAVYCAA